VLRRRKVGVEMFDLVNAVYMSQFAEAGTALYDDPDPV